MICQVVVLLERKWVPAKRLALFRVAAIWKARGSLISPAASRAVAISEVD